MQEGGDDDDGAPATVASRKRRGQDDRSQQWKASAWAGLFGVCVVWCHAKVEQVRYQMPMNVQI